VWVSKVPPQVTSWSALPPWGAETCWAGKCEPAQRPAESVDLTRDNDDGHEKIPAAFGLVDEDRGYSRAASPSRRWLPAALRNPADGVQHQVPAVAAIHACSEKVGSARVALDGDTERRASLSSGTLRYRVARLTPRT